MALFSLEMYELQFGYDVHFGDDATIEISDMADIAHTMYLRIQWPSDAPTIVQPSAGTAMIQRVELLYDHDVIERIYGENLYMLNDLTVEQSEQPALSNLVGTNITSNLAVYYIELPFAWSSQGIPLLAMDQNPEVRIVFNKSNTFTTSNYTKPIRATLMVDYVDVTEPERKWFKENVLSYPVTYWQRLQFKLPAITASTSYTFYTNFVNDVKELFWVIQSEQASNVYDYGSTDHLVNIRLNLNKRDYLTTDFATPTYLRSLQGLEYHTRVPDGRFYMYSLCTSPEDVQPSGEINMTRFERQQHDVTLALHPYRRNISLYAWSYNVVTVQNGIVTLLYKHTRENGNQSI